MKPTFGVAQVARIAGVTIHDYVRADASGVLVTSGTGIMLALMDAAPCLRWCVDLDLIRSDRERGMFLRLLDGETSLLVVAGWWTVSDPTAVRAALSNYQRTRVLALSPIDIGVPRVTSLVALAEQLATVEPRPALAPALRVNLRRAL